MWRDGGHRGFTGAKESKQFFFEKRTKKLLCLCHTPPDRTATANQKFFGSFFKKELLAFTQAIPDA
jgi:hypothetical protein